MKRALRIISLTTFTIVFARNLLITRLRIHHLMTTLFERGGNFGFEGFAAISSCWDQLEAFDFPLLVALPYCGGTTAELRLNEL